MKAKHARFPLRRTVGLHNGEREVAVCRMAFTPLRPAAADHCREAMAVGLGLLGADSPFDRAGTELTHADKIDLDTGMGTVPYAIEYAAIVLEEQADWTIAAYSDEQWTGPGLNKQPEWGDLTKPGGGASP